MTASPTDAKTMLSQCGTCVSQPPTDWQGPFTLPRQIADYYLKVGPRNISLSLAGGNETNLPSLELLWDYQVGYRIHGITGERIPEWPDAWLVVAHRAGESFIFDNATGCILHALPGAAIPGIAPLFECLNTMAASLGALEIVETETNDDFQILPKYRDALLQSVEPFVGTDNATNVLNVIGYDFAETNQHVTDTASQPTLTRQAMLEIGRRKAMNCAIKDSDEFWKLKNFRKVIEILEPFEKKLDKLNLGKLQYSRKKL